MTTQKPRTLRRLGLAIAVALIIVPLVLADQVVNTIDTTVDPALEIVTITAGQSATVGFKVVPSKDIPPGDVSGCNATGNEPATATLAVPAGVTALPSQLTFVGCGNVVNATFSSVTPGSYDIAVASVTGGKAGSGWDLAPAAFTLVVNPSPPTDTTPPLITPNIGGTLGDNGWYVSDVTVSWTVTDTESTITWSSGCGSTTISADTSGVTLTCSATSAGGTSSQSVTIKRDATAPTISGSTSPPANSNGWNNTDVTVTFTCDDATSGVASCTGPVILTGEGAGQSATGTATDNAGNSGSTTVGGINIDKTAPDILITTPAQGAVYVLNQLVLADYAATDALSGLASVVGTVPDGAAIDTSSVGSKSLTVTATDRADNVATRTVDYHVGYAVKALYDQAKAWKRGCTVPVKLQLVDANGANQSAPDVVVKAVALYRLDSSASADVADSGNANPDYDFRYDAALQGYIFNLSTKTLPSAATGTWKLFFKVDGALLPGYFVTFDVR